MERKKRVVPGEVCAVRLERGNKTLRTMAVRKEIVRNTKGMRKCLGHSIGYGKKETVHSRDFWKRYCIKTTLTERIRELRQTRERRELMA